jgi:hypothetical protein
VRIFDRENNVKYPKYYFVSHKKMQAVNNYLHLTLT